MKMPDGIYWTNSKMGFILWPKFAYTFRAMVEHNMGNYVEPLCVQIKHACVPKLERALCFEAMRTWRQVIRPDSARFDSSLVKFSQVDLGSVCIAFARWVSTSIFPFPTRVPRCVLSICLGITHAWAVATCSHAQDLQTQ